MVLRSADRGVRHGNRLDAFAQGGGASSTGTIQGRVTDAQGAVLPGVTVTATSPSALGAQTTVTSETGNYRFPAMPPGVYTVTYELAGFNTVKREGIQIALGIHGDAERRARARDAAGDGDGHGRVAGHRHDRDPRGAELQGRTAAVDSQRAATCGRCWR